MSDKLKDDWMNPPSSHSFTRQRPQKNGTVYIIQRRRRRICFGSPGSIVDWDNWSEHETKAERDAQLKKLRETTQWSVRGRTAIYWCGELVSVSNPGEFADD